MKSMILFIKGIIIGIGKIIPGVSGAVLAVILKIYDKVIDMVVNFKKNIKNNLIYLFILSLGILTGIILFSKIILYMLNNYYVYTNMLFIGLIIGGIPSINKDVDKKDYKYTFIVLIIFTIISLFNFNNTYIIKNNFIDYIIFFIGGLFEALGTIIPGLSSTSLLLLIGIYNDIIISLSNISNLIINYKILIPFSIGLIIGLIITVILMSKLLNKKKTNSFILGFILSSIFLLIIRLFNIYIELPTLLIGIIFMIIGIFISYFLG